MYAQINFVIHDVKNNSRSKHTEHLAAKHPQGISSSTHGGIVYKPDRPALQVGDLVCYNSGRQVLHLNAAASSRSRPEA